MLTVQNDRATCETRQIYSGAVRTTANLQIRNLFRAKRNLVNFRCSSREKKMKRILSVAAFSTLLLAPSCRATSVNSATPIAVVATSPAMTNVNRIGVNLGNQSQYAESDFMQNMLDNPGFEPGQSVGRGSSEHRTTRVASIRRMTTERRPAFGMELLHP